MGGKFKRILAVCIFSLLLISPALAANRVEKENFVISKEELVLGSKLDIVYLVDKVSLSISFLKPDGEKEDIVFKHGDESGYLQAEIYPDQLGEYTSESLTIDGAEIPYDGLSFKVISKEDWQEKTQGQVLVEDKMADALDTKNIAVELSKVVFYDDMGDPMDLSISLKGENESYEFESHNDGLSASVNILDGKDLAPGLYQAVFSSENWTYEKEIKILSEIQARNSSASQSTKVLRLAGDNRFKTAVDISNYLYNQSNWAVLSNGNSYTDSLAAVSLASSYDGPILFSGDTNLDVHTRDELIRLGVNNVYLIGGESAISPNIQRELEDLSINVRRISGADAIDTSLNIAREFQYNDFSDTVFMASEDNFADALSASAYSAKKKIPIIFNSQGVLEDRTKEFLSNSAISQIIIVGGPNSIGGSVKSSLEELGYNVKRISGETRYETSDAFAKEYFYGANNITIASGEVWPDAILAGNLSKRYDAPVVLSSKISLTDNAKDIISGGAGSNIFVLGGPDTLSENIIDQIKDIFAKDNTSGLEQVDTIPEHQAYKDRQEKLIANRRPGPIRIFLDQGHGWGYNKGVVDGYYEGVAMYWYGLILRNELREYGFEVDTIRNDLDAEREYCLTNGLPSTNGENVSLRGPQAEGYDILISLHTNAHNDPNVWGTEVFDSAQSPTFELARRLSETIADHFGHMNRGVKYKFDIDDSVNYGRISDEQRKTDWYGVLRTSAAPRAMMIEHGFHSNWYDCSKLMDPEFKKEMAEKTAKVVADYFAE